MERRRQRLFLRCSAWRELAEHAAETLHKGMRVIVTGRLKQREYEANDGTKRTVYELDADDIGPSLKWATATIAKTTGTGPAPRRRRRPGAGHYPGHRKQQRLHRRAAVELHSCRPPGPRRFPARP